MSEPKDLVFFARASLAAAGRADSVKIRALHIASASNSVASLEAELVCLRLSLSAAEAELLRLNDAADASAPHAKA